MPTLYRFQHRTTNRANRQTTIENKITRRMALQTRLFTNKKKKSPESHQRAKNQGAEKGIVSPAPIRLSHMQPGATAEESLWVDKVSMSRR
jgi:hypothetical protein